MIIFLQYTICDSRRLGDRSSELLSKPDWKNITPFKDFVRGSGRVIQRTKRGLENWIGENYICKINKGICHFPKILTDEYAIKCIGKHQYSNGEFLNKIEFIFQLKKINKPEFEEINNYSYDEIIKITDHILANKIRIRNTNYTYDTVELGKSFKNLKEFYITCTTKNNSLALQDRTDIHICMPQVFINFQDFEFFVNYPTKVKMANTLASVPIRMHGWIDIKNNFPFRFWLLKEEDRDYFQIHSTCRILRISFMRIHSEVECIKKICQILSNDMSERTKESDLVQTFLNITIKNISVDQNKIKKITGIDNIDSYIKEVFNELEPGIIQEIFNQIERLNFRKNIKDKTINFITTYTGNTFQLHTGTGDNVGQNKTIN